MRRLPPLTALRAFEAAARLSSISAAAAELRVSHSAVSQQIAQLEAYFGRRLFARAGRGIRPLPEAFAYLQELGTGLDRIELASAQMTRGRSRRILKINATPSFALRWLIAQAAAFQEAHPGVELRISTSPTDGIDRLDEAHDFVVRRAPMHRPGHACLRFLPDQATAVASPAFLARHAVRTPEDLRKLPLLHLRSRPDAWPDWFASVGAATDSPGLAALDGPFHDHFFLSLQAAIHGLGAAISPLVLVGDDLDRGRLVAPFVDRVLEGPGFHLLYRNDMAGDPGGRLWLDWLRALPSAAAAAAGGGGRRLNASARRKSPASPPDRVVVFRRRAAYLCPGASTPAAMPDQKPALGKETDMIIEIAQIDVTPGMEAQFEAGVTEALPLFHRAQGCKGVALYKSHEKPQRYRLMVRWLTLENHTVDFRGSADFQAWRGLVGACFAAPPEVEHVELAVGAE